MSSECFVRSLAVSEVRVRGRWMIFAGWRRCFEFFYSVLTWLSISTVDVEMLFLRQSGSRLPILEVCEIRFW